MESAFLCWRAVGWSGCLPGMLTQCLLGLTSRASCSLHLTKQRCEGKGASKGLHLLVVGLGFYVMKMNGRNDAFYMEGRSQGCAEEGRKEQLQPLCPWCSQHMYLH